MEDVVTLIKQVDFELLGLLPPLPYIASKAGVNPDTLLLLAGTMALAIGFLTAQGQFLTLLLWGLAYPAHKSLESLGDSLHERKWLLYWAIFGALAALRPLQHVLLCFLPGHDLLLTAFCLALYHPAIDLHEYFQELVWRRNQALRAFK